MVTKMKIAFYRRIGNENDKNEKSKIFTNRNFAFLLE